MEGGAWQATVHGVAKSWTRLSDFTSFHFLYSPTLTSICDYWKNRSLDQADLCWQSNVSAFQYAIQVGHNFPSKEHQGLISFRMDWLDLLAVQGTLKSLLQHHTSKASILWHSAFFIGQLSHSYMTAGKAIALTRRNFIGKVMSLLFNMLSRLVRTFLPRSQRLLISWLQSPSAAILEPPQIKSDTVSTVSPSICHEMMAPDAMIFIF